MRIGNSAKQSVYTAKALLIPDRGIVNELVLPYGIESSLVDIKLLNA